MIIPILVKLLSIKKVSMITCLICTYFHPFPVWIMSPGSAARLRFLKLMKNLYFVHSTRVEYPSQPLQKYVLTFLFFGLQFVTFFNDFPSFGFQSFPLCFHLVHFSFSFLNLRWNYVMKNKNLRELNEGVLYGPWHPLRNFLLYPLPSSSHALKSWFPAASAMPLDPSVPCFTEGEAWNSMFHFLYQQGSKCST